MIQIPALVRAMTGFAVLALVHLAPGVALAAPTEPIPAVAARGGGVDPGMLAHLRWRMIGPFRGGRTVAAVGVPGHPNLFYIGVNNGGVWKTDDAGRTWTPIFDREPTQSIGAIAVAPSDPRVLYVGSGEGLQRPDLSVGDGIYRSADGGATWEHLGLRDGQQIAALVVDAHDANRLLAAVIGHPYGPNPQRGVFRSTDGGRTWERVLYKDENTGAVDLVQDPTDAKVLYASLWAARQAPWEIGGSFGIAGSGLYRSADGGSTWQPMTQGLPGAAEGLGRIGIGVAPSRRGRIYLQVDADARHGGLYRTDDGGASWRRVNNEGRIWGRGGDFAEVKVDPKNADVVYVCNTSTYRSTDGGVTFTAIKGAPGGDDYHRIWIDPDHPEVLLLACDQGAVVSLNGGRTWSSWYNQPTAQFYHVITDNRFPYWVYGAQQESGSAAVASRGNDGEITFREFHPVGAEEYGYIAPDPLHPNLVYGGKVERFDWNTGETQDVSPEPLRSGKIRYVRTQPLLFSPVDPHILYFGASVLFRTTDGGHSWETISPDLARPKPEVPAVLGPFAADDPQHGGHRGVIYTVAPSFLDVDQLWVGTDDGLIHLTRDGGKHWHDVTPPALTAWSKVSVMEASHFDAATAYAAVNRFRLDDLRPHIYRTRDFGQTWQEIVTGIPAGEVVNAVHEDPRRRGLLFAATERGVHVSFDDGEHWQSLRLNLPATSVRDLTVHGDDLVVGTHGRSFWILDDFGALRQLDAAALAAPLHLFKPAAAVRVRRDLNTDTPLPPEEPAGQNPPDGAPLDYRLGGETKGPVTVEIRDAAGRLVRRFSSADRPEPVNERELPVPTYWLRPPTTLSAAPGMHRFVWDLRYTPPEALHQEYPIAAIYEDTPPEPLGPLVLPGEYTVVLTAGGKSSTQTLTVTMDPRVQTPAAALSRQLQLATALTAAMHDDRALLAQVEELREKLHALPPAARQGALGAALAALDGDAAALADGEPGGPGRGRRGGRVGPATSAPQALQAGQAAQAGRVPQAGQAPQIPQIPEAPQVNAEANLTPLTELNEELSRMLLLIEGADEPPTTQAEAAVADLQRRLASAQERWTRLHDHDLPDLDRQLRDAHLPPMARPTTAPPPNP